MALPPLRDWKGLAPAVLFSALAVAGWGYFVWTGTVSTIWPMLGVSNQMLAAFALAIGTSVLINMGRARYVWITLVPLAFMCVNTLTAGWMNIGINYLRPQLKAGVYFAGEHGTDRKFFNAEDKEIAEGWELRVLRELRV